MDDSQVDVEAECAPQEDQGAVRTPLGNTISSVLLVGSVGAGKSTLVNTLILEPLCMKMEGAVSATRQVAAKNVTLPLKKGTGTTTLTVYDSPGFLGDEEEDAATVEALRRIPSVDLVLVCFDITAYAGRYKPNEHLFGLKKAVEAMGADIIKNNCLVVLTKANMLSPELASKNLRTFQEEHKRRCQKLNEDLRFPGSLEMLPAGQITFENSTPKSIDTVDGSKGWLNTLFNAAGVKGNDIVTAILYNAATEAQANEAIEPSVKKDLPKPCRGLVQKSILFAGASLTTAAVASVDATPLFAADLVTGAATEMANAGLMAAVGRLLQWFSSPKEEKEQENPG